MGVQMMGFAAAVDGMLSVSWRSIRRPACRVRLPIRIVSPAYRSRYFSPKATAEARVTAATWQFAGSPAPAQSLAEFSSQKPAAGPGHVVDEVTGVSR